MRNVLRTAIIGIAAGLILSPSSLAQPGRNQRQQPGRNSVTQRRQGPQNGIAEFKAAAEVIARQFEVRIAVDSAIWVPGKPKAPVDAPNLATALDQLVIQARKATWKKVYLKGGAAANVLPEKLGESLRAIDAVEQSGMVVESPAARRASTLVKDYAVPQDFGKELEAQQFDPDGIYVIYSTVPGALAGKSATDRIAEMQRESMELMMQLDEGQLQDAVQHGLDMFMNMDPGMRAKFMGMQMRAGMQAFMNMPPDQRNQLMQDIMGQMGPMFGGQGAPGAPGAPGRKP